MATFETTIVVRVEVSDWDSYVVKMNDALTGLDENTSEDGVEIVSITTEELEQREAAS